NGPPPVLLPLSDRLPDRLTTCTSPLSVLTADSVDTVVSSGLLAPGPLPMPRRAGRLSVGAGTLVVPVGGAVPSVGGACVDVMLTVLVGKLSTGPRVMSWMAVRLSVVPAPAVMVPLRVKAPIPSPLSLKPAVKVSEPDALTVAPAWMTRLSPACSTMLPALVETVTPVLTVRLSPGEPVSPAVAGRSPAPPVVAAEGVGAPGAREGG